MSSLASSFATAPQQQANTDTNDFFSKHFNTTSSSTLAGTNFTGTGAFSASPAPSPLLPQTTGFGGSLVKPFKPSSSFGASLADSLPPLSAQPTGLVLNSPNLNGTSTGQAFNPFRASTLGIQPTGQPAFTTSFNGTSSSAWNQPLTAQSNSQQGSLI